MPVGELHFGGFWFPSGFPCLVHLFSRTSLPPSSLLISKPFGFLRVFAPKTIGMTSGSDPFGFPGIDLWFRSHPFGLERLPKQMKL